MARKGALGPRSDLKNIEVRGRRDQENVDWENIVLPVEWTLVDI